MENQAIALVVSFLAMILVVVSYFVKKKAYYLLFQFFGIFLLVVSYFFTLQFFAMIGLSIGLARTLVFFLYEQKEKVAPLYWSFFFSIGSISAYYIVNYGILKTVQPFDALCLISLIMYTFIFRIRNLKIVRFTMLIPLFLSMLFNLLTRAPIFATISYGFEFFANIISILKYHVFYRTKDNVNEKEEYFSGIEN